MELDSSHSCGICGKAIADQGVLDCCQHPFCFSCIDDWASVTNLCPICKLRFRLITCLPGKSSEPSSNEESAADRKRDDEQHCPSFYIDEEAVTCLEGDECLVRSGKAFEVEADDTSVACDSCDCWYHAGCVGFDTSGCTQESWWCPRCIEANTGPHPASKKAAAVEILVDRQQKNSHEITTLDSQSCHRRPECIIDTKTSESFTVTASDATDEKNPRKRKRTDVGFITAVDLPELRRNGEGKGLVVSSAKDFAQSNCASSNRSPPTGGHESANDLLDIVKDPGYRVAEAEGRDGYEGPRSAGDSGIRTRIIMHRAESGDSSVVEQIRQQMRNAAGYGAAVDLGQVDLSDDRFLAAYKAAVAAKYKADTQSKKTVQKGSSWVMKALTRGTSVRDKLTRKLYGGTSTRRTWDRDWDVSFWKQGRGASKKSSENNVPVEGSPVQPDSAAEKVYLADSSLFARKDDDEPLSGAASDCQFSIDLCDMNFSDKVVAKGPMIDCRGNGQQLSQQHTGLSSKSKSQKDLAGSGTPLPKLDMTDKRKWALEVLARKKGELGPKDSLATPKGKKYQSLMGFLPLELRPSIDINLSSKIPSAVRQAQLNRILELELRSSGVRRNPRSVKCQQAIAAAVSKEQEIFEKSPTKGVYMNLCARATSSEKGNGKKAANSSTDCKVREALEAAGLLSDADSDSPPVALGEKSDVITKVKEDKPSHRIHPQMAQEGNSTSPVNLVSAQIGTLVSHEVPGKSAVTPAVPSLDLQRKQSPLGAEIFCFSPLYLDEDFGLDSEELETPMVIGHALNAGHKEGTSKVKVVLTTFNKFKQSSALTEAGTEVAMPEKVMGDFDECGAISTGPKSGELCRDTSGGSIVDTVKADCISLSCALVDGNVTDADCASIDPNKAEIVVNSTKSAECQAANSEGQHKAPNHNVLTSSPCEQDGLEGCTDNVSVPSSRTDSKSGALDDPLGASSFGLPASETVPVPSVEESTLVGPADVDDWMKVGKFPNLESRIEEVRSRVLKKSAGVLTKLLTKYPTSAPNDPGGSSRGMEGMDSECAQNVKELEDSLDEFDGTHQSEVKEANPSIQKQVHAYVREHLRPLYKSGVITAKEYHWATSKTASKVMQYHPAAKSAAFLIAEGSKVKKLAEDYLQAFTQRKA